MQQKENRKRKSKGKNRGARRGGKIPRTGTPHSPTPIAISFCMAHPPCTFSLAAEMPGKPATHSWQSLEEKQGKQKTEG
ncbi:hypothetical protein Y1Q_0004763 [Alligator mississippiensis]|uniref:Uncharacterized protein n=1 Tax=Alligator mississippiensis TaxID=8496 RepID=A0A151NLW2_ALLMI|nr:hypothetical protein Y1Q_0004763 [Alligator mississippiensis]